MGKLMRKLNNGSGKTIFMALLLLLVAVVVSVVIVTVAVTSVMHVQDNKTSQQEYLACSSAANLIKDCVAGSTYTYTEMEGTYQYTKPTKNGGGTTTDNETKLDIPPEEKITPENGSMENFVKTLSQVVREADWASATGELYPEKDFTVKQNVNDIIYDVSVKCKLVKNSDIENQFLLKFKLSCADEGSQGYVMSMVIPLTKSKPPRAGDKRSYECTLDDVSDLVYTYGSIFGSRKTIDYRNEHRETDSKGNITNERIEHQFDITYDVTQVDWTSATDSSLIISKGAKDYDN